MLLFINSLFLSLWTFKYEYFNNSFTTEITRLQYVHVVAHLHNSLMLKIHIFLPCSIQFIFIYAIPIIDLNTNNNPPVSFFNTDWYEINWIITISIYPLFVRGNSLDFHFLRNNHFICLRFSNVKFFKTYIMSIFIIILFSDCQLLHLWIFSKHSSSFPGIHTWTVKTNQIN